jgi:hypothetical protein
MGHCLIDSGGGSYPPGDHIAATVRTYFELLTQSPRYVIRKGRREGRVPGATDDCIGGNVVGHPMTSQNLFSTTASKATL